MFIKVNKVVGQEPSAAPIYDELHETTTQPAAAPAEITSPAYVNLDDVREIYPRKHGRTGTRIVFRNGVGCPVTDAFEDVARYLTTN